MEKVVAAHPGRRRCGGHLRRSADEHDALGLLVGRRHSPSRRRRKSSPRWNGSSRGAREHPLALHLYIHAVEASDQPGTGGGRGGQRWPIWCPGLGIWCICRRISTGGSGAMTMRPRPMSGRPPSTKYISRPATRRDSIPALYYPHNIHFLWAASSMAGQSKMAHRGGAQGRRQRPAGTD